MNNVNYFLPYWNTYIQLFNHSLILLYLHLSLFYPSFVPSLSISNFSIKLFSILLFISSSIPTKLLSISSYLLLFIPSSEWITLHWPHFPAPLPAPSVYCLLLVSSSARLLVSSSPSLPRLHSFLYWCCSSPTFFLRQLSHFRTRVPQAEGRVSVWFAGVQFIFFFYLSFSLFSVL